MSRKEDKTLELSEDQIQFKHDFSLFISQSGLSTSAGDMVAYLLICEPPQQSANQLKQALNVAKSTISTTVRTLMAIGFVKKVRVQGKKGDYYQYNYEMVDESAKKRIEGLEPFIQYYERAYELNDPISERGKVLAEMIEQSRFLQNEYKKVHEKWLKYKKEKYG